MATIGAVAQAVVHGVNFAVSGPRFFSVNSEYNAFAWWQASMIFLAAYGSVIVAYTDSARRRAALTLAGILCFLSLDEAVLIHERLARGILEALGLSETWDSALWPVLYIPLAVVIVVSLSRVADHSTPRIRRYVGIAIGSLIVAALIEIASAPWSTGENVIHVVAGAFEEAAELVGWTLLAAGLNARAQSAISMHSSTVNEARTMGVGELDSPA